MLLFSFLTDYRYIDLSDTSLFLSHFDKYNAEKESFAVKVLKPNVLTPGATYKFILTVNDGAKSGSSNMIVEVRNGPTSGSFKTPTAAVKELDSVTLSGMFFMVEVILDRRTIPHIFFNFFILPKIVMIITKYILY